MGIHIWLPIGHSCCHYSHPCRSNTSHRDSRHILHQQTKENELNYTPASTSPYATRTRGVRTSQHKHQQRHL